MYGPVRTVVWEGRGREASPYPDFSGSNNPLRANSCSASRRAIALALTELTARATRGMSTPRAYALDVLLAEPRAEKR